MSIPYEPPRRGVRFGQTKFGTPTSIDPDDERRRVGLLVRELRIHAEMKLKDFADAMNDALGEGQWTVDTVSLVQTGRRRLSLREQFVLSRIFSVSWDEILEVAFSGDEILRTPDPGAAVPALTAEDALTIRARYAAGETGAALGTAFGVTAGTISRVVNGLSWKRAGGTEEAE